MVTLENYKIIFIYIFRKMYSLSSLKLTNILYTHFYLSSLDISKATGLDGIGLRILKVSSGITTKSITYIAQKCLSAGEFPSSWKQAKVTPLHKGGA